MPAQTEYEVPAAWGQSPFTELELPSGGKCLAKRLDFEAILAADLMDEFDKLSPVAEDKVVAPAKGKRPADRPAKKLTKAQQAKQDEAEQREFFKSAGFQGMLSIIARVLPFMVVKPTIHSSMRKSERGDWELIPPDEREAGNVYVDSIPMMDQMHIFGWAMEGMNMEDLQQFREQPEQAVGAVEPVEKPAGPPE